MLADRHTLDEATKEMDLMKKLHHPSLLPLLDSSVVQVQGTSSGASHVVYMLFPLYEVGSDEKQGAVYTFPKMMSNIQQILHTSTKSNLIL